MKTDPAPLLAAAAGTPLAGIAGRVVRGERLDRADGILLLTSPDLTLLGLLADFARRRAVGDRVAWRYNLHVNQTNICTLRCPLCAFSRDAGDPDAYFLPVEAVLDTVKQALPLGIDEVHLVGGVTAHADLAYFETVFRRLRQLAPGVSLQALTAVEIDALAVREGLPLAAVLSRLQAAGLDAVPGGGAEIFSPRVRALVAPDKIPGTRWLEVMAEAHRAGIPTNATLLYGHLETPEEAVDHLLALRTQQHATGGFQALVPLAFHPEHTGLCDRVSDPPTGTASLRLFATARLVLDNVPHLKALALYLGPRLAQVALSFGADDLGGPSRDEKIARAAGAKELALPSPAAWEDLIRAAGRESWRVPGSYRTAPGARASR